MVVDMGYTIVCGSLNMDLVCRGPRIPKPGETILGYNFKTFFGGKGGNQAVAHAKLGGDTYMIGCVGNDSYGDEILNALQDVNIKTERVKVVEVETGTAHIMVEDSGENNIVVIPGANQEVSIDMVKDAEIVIKDSSCLLAQLEIPIESVHEFFAIGRKYGKLNILNPAPMPDYGLSDELLSLIDILIPNETEMKILTGIEIEDKASFLEAASILHHKGVEQVICTLGAKGSYYSGHDKFFEQEAYEIVAVDTTCAGDSYIASLIIKISQGQSIEKAMDFASKVASLTVTKEGAQNSIPTKEEANI